VPIPLPDLDDRTYDDLVAEAWSLIPAYAPEWTDHNASDPGITLLELFAWLAEMLIFRANQVPPRHVVTFLRLLNGPGWKPGRDLDDDIADTISSLRRRSQAVTCEDYEELALEASYDARKASHDVARAHCVRGRDVTATSEPERLAHREGHVSVILVPRKSKLDAEASAALRKKVLDNLEPYRVLTTRHHVGFPVKAPVAAEALVARRPDVPDAAVRAAVESALARFLDPRHGGRDGRGWPFARPVYVSELYELLDHLPEVEYVPDVWLTSRCPAGEAGCAPAAEIWHEEGDLVGLRIEPHQLPDARIDRAPPMDICGARLGGGPPCILLAHHTGPHVPSRIVTATRFLPVSITVHVRSKGDPAEIRRAVKSSLRRLFHPLHDGPPVEGPPWQVLAKIVASRSRNVSGVTSVAGVELASDLAREVRDDGTVVAVTVQDGELVDARIAVAVEGPDA
jgi:hypothetical protein